MNIRKLTTVLTAIATVLALGEFGSTVVIWAEAYAGSLPAGAAVFGVLFLIGAFLMRTSRVGFGTIYLGVLCLFEVVEFPSWARHSVLDVVYQTGFAVASLIGLGVAVTLFVARRRLPSVTASPARADH